MPSPSATKPKPIPVAAETPYSVRVRLFGVVELENRYGRVTENRSRQSLSWLLLKYLLVNPGREIGLEELIGTLWPATEGNDEGAARVRLRRLREALAPLHLDGRSGLVLFSLGKYCLNPDYEVHSDEDELLRLLARIRISEPDEAGGLEACAQALELMRGEFMEYTPDAPWLRRYRDYYRREAAWLCRATLERCSAPEDGEALSLLCRRAAALVPEDEELHRAIIGRLLDGRMEIELMRHIAQLSRSGKAAWLEDIE